MALLRDKEKRNQLRHDLDKKMDEAGASLPLVVKTIRKMLNKDQAEFAELVSISLATLRKIEQDRGNVTMASVKKILDRFSLELIVKRKVNPPESES